MSLQSYQDALDRMDQRMEEYVPAWNALQRKLHPKTLDWKGTVTNQRGNYGFHVYETLDGQCILIDPTIISSRVSGFVKVGSIEEGKEIAEQSFQINFDYLTGGCWKEAA